MKRGSKAKRPSATAPVIALLAALAALALAPSALAGDGTFPSDATGSPFFTGGFPMSVAVGDFDSDGNEDLAVASLQAGLAVRLGAGDGTFGPIAAFGAVSPPSVAVGDFNGDGNEDLVAAQRFSSNVVVRLGGGDGTFAAEAPGSPFAAGSGPISVAVGDFNGDGNEDLAVANQNSNDITVRLGAGNGTFAAEAPGSPFAAGSGPISVAVGDFDGDGDEDLAVANESSNNVTVRLGEGNGTFPNQPPGSPLAAGNGPRSLAVGDFDRDGNEDLAVANGGSNDVTVLVGNGNGTFGAGTGFSANSAHSITVGDFNSDGGEDLAVTNDDASTVTVRLGAGDGTFPTEPSGSPFATRSHPRSVAVGDFDSDGNEDLAVSNFSDHTVTVRLGAGNRLLDGNLLHNGGIEGSGAARRVGQAPALPGLWQRASGRFTYARYGIAAGPPRLFAAARWEGGLNAFWGGPTASDSSASQAVNVSSHAVSIDQGLATATLAADLGGRGTRNDRMRATARFLDPSGAELGSVELDPVTAADRGNRTVLVRRAQSEPLPAGTREIEVRLAALHASGPTNDAYADNVKLTLDAPLPVPVNTSPPVIVDGDDPAVWTQLLSQVGSWQRFGQPTTYSRQWLRCDQDGNGCVEIAGKTKKDYVPKSEDIGHTLRHRVIASNADGSSPPAFSAPTGVVALPVPVNTSPPVILDGADPTVGTQLLSQVGSWQRFGAPTTYARMWLRCDADGDDCVEIGRTKKDYVPKAADVGHTLRHRVIAKNASGPSAPAVSAPSGVVQ